MNQYTMTGDTNPSSLSPHRASPSSSRGDRVSSIPTGVGSPGDQPCLATILEALRKTHRSEGLVGLSSLIENATAAGSHGSTTTAGINLPSGSHSRVSPPIPTTGPFKRRKDDHVYQNRSPHDQSSYDSNRPSSNQSCSSIIAQLSTDIIHNRLSSASPSSLSSSSSSSRSYTASPLRTGNGSVPVPMTSTATDLSLSTSNRRANRSKVPIERRSHRSEAESDHRTATTVSTLPVLHSR